MSDIDNGGPAFPAPSGQGRSGMSLRDYFAGRVAAGDAAKESAVRFGISDANMLKRARLYYQVADAMMLARDEDPLGSANDVDNLADEQ